MLPTCLSLESIYESRADGLVLAELYILVPLFSYSHLAWIDGMVVNPMPDKWMQLSGPFYILLSQFVSSRLQNVA
jgi:hypothetical protein